MKAFLGRTFVLVLVLKSFSGVSLANDRAGNLMADFDPGRGTVEFKAIGRPSAIHILGKGSGPKGVLTWNGSSLDGQVIMELGTLDTGIAMRDRHMKERYLEVGRFPEARLKVEKMGLPATLGSDEATIEELPFQGKLFLHGVERPVNGKARVHRHGESVEIQSRFGMRLSDFNIAVPSFAGITVADEVEINVRSTAEIKKPGR